MKFQNFFASRLLMESVDILRYDCLQLSHLLELCQRFVRPVRLRIWEQHLIPVEPVKFFRLSHIEGMAEDRLRRIIVFLVVQSVCTPEIRNMALRGHTCPTEKYNVAALIQPLFNVSRSVMTDLLLPIIKVFSINRSQFHISARYHSAPVPVSPVSHDFVQEHSMERLDKFPIWDLLYLSRRPVSNNHSVSSRSSGPPSCLSR